MKKLIIAMILGIMMIGCGKGDNWYKAPYAKETIMAEGKIDETQITADNVYWRFAGAFLTYFLCLSVVLVIKRIPYLRVVFP